MFSSNWLTNWSVASLPRSIPSEQGDLAHTHQRLENSPQRAIFGGPIVDMKTIKRKVRDFLDDDKEEEHLKSSMKKTRVEDLDFSRDFSFNIGRSSTPDPDTNSIKVSASQKRPRELSESSSALPDLDNELPKKRKYHGIQRVNPQ